MPGPANWWPEDYDFKGHGFWVPDQEDAPRYKGAWDLMFQLFEDLLSKGLSIDWFASTDNDIANFCLINII